MRAHNSRLPVLILTAGDSIEQREQCYSRQRDHQGRDPAAGRGYRGARNAGDCWPALCHLDLIAASGLATALSTADGLLLTISNTLSHDIYYKTVDPTASTQKRVAISKLLLIVVALVVVSLLTPAPDKRSNALVNHIPTPYTFAIGMFLVTL